MYDKLYFDTRFKVHTTDGYYFAIHPWGHTQIRMTSLDPSVVKAMNQNNLEPKSLAVVDGTVDITFPTVPGSEIQTILTFWISRACPIQRADKLPDYKCLKGKKPKTFAYLNIFPTAGYVAPPTKNTWGYRTLVASKLGLGRKSVWLKNCNCGPDGSYLPELIQPSQRVELHFNAFWEKLDIDAPGDMVFSDGIGIQMDFELMQGVLLYTFLAISKNGDVSLSNVGIGYDDR